MNGNSGSPFDKKSPGSPAAVVYNPAVTGEVVPSTSMEMLAKGPALVVMGNGSEKCAELSCRHRRCLKPPP